mmetsp:Transcript_11250/g.22412  ORF Transcript_11250/g.22412 Transcript_11250/m.22412 type:complete len:400 (-) Transcript_11250:111-1310(-)
MFSTRHVSVLLLALAAMVVAVVGQDVMLSVSVSANGEDLSMTLLRGESPLQAAYRFVQEHPALGAAVEPGTDQATPMTIQLAEILLQRLQEQETQKAQPPELMASFPVVRDDGAAVNFEHYKGNDVALEAQEFCQVNIPALELGQCVGQLLNGAQQVMLQREREEQEQASKAAEKKVVLEVPIDVNGETMRLGLREGDDSSSASDFFCRSLNLGDQDYAICVSSVQPLIDAKIRDFMAQQQQQQQQAQSGPPLFEIPIQIGDRLLPMAFTLGENPADTTIRFCDAQWGFISTVLQSYEEGGAITKDLCVNTLFSTVSKMLDEMLASEEGIALTDREKLFSIEVELTPEQEGIASRQLSLNVFPGQTAEAAVSAFLNQNGIGDEAKGALMDMVANRLASI